MIMIMTAKVATNEYVRNRRGSLFFDSFRFLDANSLARA